MRIVLIASMYAPHVAGGAELVAQNQAEGLAARGHRVTVLTLGEPGQAPVRTSLNGVDVLRLGIRNLYFPGTGETASWQKVAWHARDVYNPRMARAARECVADLQPDVVVCHNVWGWSAALWPALRSTGVPFVQVLHDQYVRCVRSNMFTTRMCVSPCVSCRVMRLPHLQLSRLPDAVVGVSRYAIDSLSEAGYFRGVPLRTHLHNVSHLDTRALPTPALSSEEVVFGFIGSLTPNKGIEHLLRVFRRCARPNWRLRVAGGGEPGYVERLREGDADARIQFLGRQDPSAFYLGLDVTVVPSLWADTYPSVVFESLIHGRPVIGSRAGGIPEMIADGRSGLLYGRGDDTDLARALLELAEHVDEWRARQQDIKAAAVALYCDREQWIARWESLLAQVAARSR
jgi:glycosyltransferase involved in cell wall biosynthesis